MKRPCPVCGVPIGPIEYALAKLFARFGGHWWLRRSVRR